MQLAQAIEILADEFSDASIADSLTCSEVDSVARVLALAGHEKIATNLVRQHVAADQADGAHFGADAADCINSLTA